MELKLRPGLIKNLRSEKLWTQEQLAEACGLGLRTIQRLEAQGNASLETIRSLSSVFEVEADDLVLTSDSFKPYKHSQRNYLLLAVPPLMPFVVLLLSTVVAEPYLIIAALLATAVTVLVLLFHCLTVEVTASSISWSLWLGILKKKIPLSSVVGCEIYDVPKWWLADYGLNPLLDNYHSVEFAGAMAIKIQIETGAAFIVGTDEPPYLKSAIDAALKFQAPSNDEPST